MDDVDNAGEAVIQTVDTASDNKAGYGSLAQYMAQPSVSIHQHPDKALFKLNLLRSVEDPLLDVSLEIPAAFKSSLFCQAFIAYCYTDAFKVLSDLSKQRNIHLYKRFFLFLNTHDQKCNKDNTWSELVATSNDLPHTVIHEFLLHLSASGTGASTLRGHQLYIIKTIRWATELSVKTGMYRLAGGDKLLPYLTKKVNPDIKADDVTPKPALSQLFSIDHETGEEIQCPYSDSQIITNLRWFARWYLDIMRERRLFLRKIKWDQDRTIYKVLTEKLTDGTWSLDSKPVTKMFVSSDATPASLPDFLEASGMYAKIYEALLPSKSEIKQIENGTLSLKLTNRLLWLESLGYKLKATKSLFDEIRNYQGNINGIIKRNAECIAYNTSYSLTRGHSGKKIIAPITLKSDPVHLRSVLVPKFSLVDLIFPTSSERQVMSWLLASDCIQWSNQRRLSLTDFKQAERGKTLKILTPQTFDDVNVNEAKVRHYKMRGKGRNAKGKGKSHESITYKRGDPLLTTYTNWLDDMTEAQVHLKKGKGQWFHLYPQRKNDTNVFFPLSFLCAETSLFRTAFEKDEQELKYHSELNGQGAFRWLLSANVKHAGYLRTNSDYVREITISSDAIRQSRIIFNEGRDMTDAENAKETAHNEDQVVSYREAGVAKERILNGIKGNAQVANKMVAEAMSILDSCHMMSLEEVQKSLHDPSGFTANDVVKLINQIAATPKKYDVTIFGGIIDKADPDAGIKIINDKNSALMMWSYIKHMESELQSIKENHDEEQVVKHLFEHAQWSILFDRFSVETQRQGKALAEQYTIPYPPLF